jgi:hypothetical protein
MIRDVFLDIVKHTHSLGFLDTAKVVGSDETATIEAMDPEKSVVLYGKLNDPIPGLEGTVGLSRMSVLHGYLNFSGFAEEEAEIEIIKQTKGDEEIPVELQFTSPQGHTANYRFMSGDVVEEQLKTVKFKGVTWDVTINPTQKSIKDLSQLSGILGSFEPNFVAKTDKKGNLNFYIGTGPTDRTIIPFATGVVGDLKKGWAWSLSHVLQILKLSSASQCTISFSDLGAMSIEIDSGLGVYTYILPARSH